MPTFYVFTTTIIGFLFSFNFSFQRAEAYPQFIGYKYASCLTCHYNGQGNGPLNDYGRALWSAEIAGRLWSKNKTEEELSDSSGFLGTTQLPYWFRPGVKVRDLQLISNPGATKSVSTNILMQADVNAAFFFDEDQKYGFVGSYGYLPKPQGARPDQEFDEWISREHYIRIQATEALWIYAGLLDKVYGIRINNHTAYSRSRTGLAQNDQSYGVIAHYIAPTWELTGNYFVGNTNIDEELRQVGGSMMFEYEWMEASRVGFSGLISTNDFDAQTRVGGHIRHGLGDGSALMLEVGVLNNAPPPGAPITTGYYMYSEAIQKLTRGYHLFFTAQAFKQDMKSGVNDNLRFGAGFLIFPMARTEFRVEVENTQQLTSSSEVNPEIWALLAQIHLAL